MSTEFRVTELEIKDSFYGRCHAYHWPAEKVTQSAPKIVTIVHGIGEHMGRYAETAQFLAQQGFHVIGTDLPGHGLNRKEWGHKKLPSVHDMLEAVQLGQSEMLKKFFPNQRIDPKNCFLLGHSMGALISLLWIVRAEPDTFPFQRSFISSPPLVLSLPIPQWKSTLSKLTYRLTPYLSVPNGISSSWLSHDEAVVLAYDQDPLTHSYSSPALHETMLEASIEVREKHGKVESPIFLIVGEKDPIVSPQAIQVFYEQLSTHRKIVRYPNFLHECFNELGREKVWKDLLEWISQKN